MPSLTQISYLLSERSEACGFLLIAAFAGWRILSRMLRTRAARQALQSALERGQAEPISLHPEFDYARCMGCGSCIRACPEGKVIELIDHRPVLVSAAACLGHGECQQACPNGAIQLVFGTKTRGMEIPRLSPNFETNIPGLYIAGELGGMGLIRNAIRQGSLAARHAIEKLPKLAIAADVDLLVVGAGPAGLAACLEAIVQKRSYLCIEQGTFGGTVNNFPRQKLVTTHPAELPGVGLMRFHRNRIHKEDLLTYWNRVRKRTGLEVREKVRFLNLERKGAVFAVATSEGVVTARKVILALGVRGSPRKLGLANEDLPKVTYNLIDPEQYQNQDIAIVGGGNSAAEAAMMLAQAKLGNRVTLLVRGGLDRCSEANRNAVRKLADAGRLQISYQTQVTAIEPATLTVETPEGSRELPNDFLLILAGTESPLAYLLSLGVGVQKKFGESLGGRKGAPAPLKKARAAA